MVIDNKMKEIAVIFGVELGEEFNIKNSDRDYLQYSPYKFTEEGLVDKDGHCSPSWIISNLIKGKYTIEKIPFVPKVGEYYWTYRDIICRYIWDNTIFHKERKILGIVFRTEQEAKDYLPTWISRLEGKEV